MSSVFRPLRSGKSSDSISTGYRCAQVVRFHHAPGPFSDPLLMSQGGDDRDFPRNAMSAMILSASSLPHPVFRGCVPGLGNDRGVRQYPYGRSDCALPCACHSCMEQACCTLHLACCMLQITRGFLAHSFAKAVQVATVYRRGLDQ